MAGIALGRLLGKIEASRVSGNSGQWQETVISSVVNDSRKCVPGALFFAVRGSKIDATAFLNDALAKGAAAVIVEEPAPPVETFPVPLISVPDIRECLAEAASVFYGRPTGAMRSIGVTGTNGKTSVAWLLGNLLPALGEPAAVVGTLGFAFAKKALAIEDFQTTSNTTPDPLDVFRFLAAAREQGARALAAEATSQAVVQKRTITIEWDSGIFTNLTRDHLDLHGTLENYAAIKSRFFTEELVRSPKTKKTAVINIDDEVGRRICAELAGAPVKCCTYSTCSKADAYTTSSEVTLNGTRLEAVLFGESAVIESRLIGRFNLSNILAAVACLVSLGFEPEEVVNAVKDVPPVPGRLELVAQAPIHVFVDYAHTPDALVNVQQSLRDLEPRRLITVFGCGGDRDRGKRPLMGRVVAEMSDLAVVTSDNPRSEEPDKIIEDILPGIAGAARPSHFCYEVIADRRAAVEFAVSAARPGDAVLVAGKGHEDYQEIKGVKHPFLDRNVCLGAMAARGIV